MISYGFTKEIDVSDCWLNLDITVELEAKAKERAVLKHKKHIDTC